MDAVGYKITKEMKLALWSTSIINLSQKLKLVVHVKLVAIYQTRNKFTQTVDFLTVNQCKSVIKQYQSGKSMIFILVEERERQSNL